MNALKNNTQAHSQPLQGFEPKQRHLNQPEREKLPTLVIFAAAAMRKLPLKPFQSQNENSRVSETPFEIPLLKEKKS